MTNNKNFQTIMVFTQPKKNPITNQYNSIVSSHIILKPLKFKLNSEEMVNNLDLVYNNKLKIIMISDKSEGIKRTISIGNSIQSKYELVVLPKNLFYTVETLRDLLLNESINKTIFIFNNLDYCDIVANFATFKLIISGGSNTKKHIISPIQMRLARFLIAINEFSDSEVVESFHFERVTGKSKAD